MAAGIGSGNCSREMTTERDPLSMPSGCNETRIAPPDCACVAAMAAAAAGYSSESGNREVDDVGFVAIGEAPWQLRMKTPWRLSASHASSRRRALSD